jgi:hypothetical protein
VAEINLKRHRDARRGLMAPVKIPDCTHRGIAGRSPHQNPADPLVAGHG